MMSVHRSPNEAVTARLGNAHWPRSAYPRTELPERVLQFGTGMLLRAVSAAAVDAANRAGAFQGRIVVVQSTPRGCARTMNAQDGLFTLLECGLERGVAVERTRLIGSISRALVADAEWFAVREVVARPELQVIVSNVTEAGFRLDAPTGYPGRLADLLYTRFERLPDGPPVFVIPTELVDDNGPRLAAMVEQLAGRFARAGEFRDWVASSVRFCSSLVDRITTGARPPEVRAEVEARLGYTDTLLTVTEPHSLWAIEADSEALRAAFAIDVTPNAVVFAPDIGFYRERKLRLLNGAHTALAPLALLAGVPTVREAAADPRLGAFLRHVLFDELVPATEVPREDAESFARTVLDRFGNPWLDHEWRVIAQNQTVKMRLRVLPAIAGFAAKRGRVLEGLALCCAAYLRYVRCVAGAGATEGTGWWAGATYPVVDADLASIDTHWAAVDPARAPAPVPPEVLERLAARVLADAMLWGHDLSGVPGFLASTTRWLLLLEREGVHAALDVFRGLPAPAAPRGA
jgi:tagaturonate reductase